MAYKPAQHLTVAPPGAENLKKFDFPESFKYEDEGSMNFLSAFPISLPPPIPESFTFSVAPPGLNNILRFFPGGPFGHPRLAYQACAAPYYAPSGG
jgi:hypothetical protein